MSIINNIFFRIYLGFIIASLSTSVFTNMNSTGTASASPNLKTLNNWSNNVLAMLLMPIYIPYRMCNYIYNNFDLVLTKIHDFFKFIFVDVICDKIIMNVVKFFEYIYKTLIVPFFRYVFVDIIYEQIILNVIKLFEYINKTLIVPFFRYVFVDIIYEQIILNVIKLFDYMCEILSSFLRMFLNAITASFYQVCNLLEWGWNMFLYYIAYPVFDVITFIYNLGTGTLLKIWLTIVNMYDVCINVLYNVYIGISDTLSDIWVSLLITFKIVYDNMTVSIMQSWERLMNLF